MAGVRYISSDVIKNSVAYKQYINAVRDGYIQHGDGAPAKPRQKLTKGGESGYRGGPSGMLTSYMAILPESGVMGGHMYSAGFESADAWMFTPLFDANTGEPIALLDGSGMNPFKTGAVSAVSSDCLARDDSTDVAIIGSGEQAKAQLLFTTLVRDIENARVYSPTEENRQKFEKHMQNVIDANVRAVESASKAVNNADIVITATTSHTPVFNFEDLASGTHIVAMGQYHPDRREIDAKTISRSKYIPDLHDRALKDAGSLLYAVNNGNIQKDHIHAELGEVLAGNAVGRETQNEITVFDSGGSGIETVAAGYMLYKKAEENNSGTEIEMESLHGFLSTGWENPSSSFI